MLTCYVFLEEITNWLEERALVDSIYLDFQKAFDKVSYHILLKLKAHGNAEAGSNNG